MTGVNGLRDCEEKINQLGLLVYAEDLANFSQDLKVNAKTLAYLIVSVVSIGSTAEAVVINSPQLIFQSKIAALKPGDILNLAAGTYSLLYLTNMEGKADAWITVQGPKTGEPAIISVKPSNPFCCNLVQLENVAYLAIKNLRVDSAHYDWI